ncbi:MAG: ATP-binding protein [Phycisphaerae bacterium]
MATLHVLQGPDKGRILKTSEEAVLIGRGSDLVPLTDQSVSRRHAELKREDGAWILRDLNSANGTYVNGTRIQEPTRLKHGDQIKLGSTLLMYSGDESPEQLSGANIPTDLVTLDADRLAVDSSVVASVPSADDSVVLAAPDTAYAVKSWKAVRELTDVIGSLLAPDQLLQRVMDIVFEEVPADRGVIFLRDEESGELLPAVVRFRSREARAGAARSAITASRTIVDHVVETQEGVLCSNAIRDKRFSGGKSVRRLGKRSLICAPIMAREQILGVIHLDCPTSEHTYNEHELRLITAIGYQTGLAIENARLVQTHLERERLAAAGETVAYLSHSIKNMLQGMRAGGDMVQRGLDRRDFAVTTKGWRILDRNLGRCYTLMLNMLAFSKQREPQLEMLRLNKIVSDVVELVQEQADESNITLRTDLDVEVPPIPVDYDGVHQAVLNLISNALDAVPRGDGVIDVRTRFDPVERWVIISVADNGPGVPESQRSKIFEPFHSTKGQGGTGLGLAVARKNVNELGGSIELCDVPEGGSEFVVRLPTAEARRAAPGDTHGPAG